MAFTAPAYSNEIVDLAGEALLSSTSMANGIDCLDVINNRRAAHNYPLNTFQATLRQRAARVDQNAVVAQRIKRLSSISSKLQRYDWLTLSEMQDIAGCRAIVNSVQQVYDLAEIYQRKYAGHELSDVKNYIQNPKSDGYRSFHLVWCIRSSSVN